MVPSSITVPQERIGPPSIGIEILDHFGDVVAVGIFELAHGGRCPEGTQPVGRDQAQEHDGRRQEGSTGRVVASGDAELTAVRPATAATGA